MLEAGAVSSDKDKLTENRFIYESGNRTIIEAVFYHANDLLPDEKVFLQPAQAFPMYIKNISVSDLQRESALVCCGVAGYRGSRNN